MLGTTYRGELHEVKLTRGNVVVYLINNQNGLSLSKRISVTLTDLEMSDSDLEERYDSIEDSLLAGDNLKGLQTISYIADIIPPDKDKSAVLNRLLEYVTQVSVTTLSDVKMCTSTLTNVLVALNTPNQLALSPNMMMDTLEVIKTQANIFQRFVFDRVISQWMSAEEIRQVASVILTCLNAGLMCKDPGTENVPPDDFKLKLLNELRRVSRFTEETIELTKKAVSYVQTSGQPPSKVASSGDKIVMWAMDVPYGARIFPILASVLLPSGLQSERNIFDFPPHPLPCIESNVQGLIVHVGTPAYNDHRSKPVSKSSLGVLEDEDSYPMNDVLTQNTDIPVNISSLLFRSLQKQTTPGAHMALAVTRLTDNIYWWRTSDIKSDFVSISLNRQFQQKRIAVTELTTPLDFKVKLNKDVESVTVTGITTQLDPNMTELDLELTLNIHRIDCPSRSLTSIKFNFPPTNSSLRASKNIIGLVFLALVRHHGEELLVRRRQMLTDVNSAARKRCVDLLGSQFFFLSLLEYPLAFLDPVSKLGYDRLLAISLELGYRMCGRYINLPHVQTLSSTHILHRHATLMFSPRVELLEVYALPDFRPDHEMVTSKYVNITQISPFYPVVYNKEEEPSFLFVAILPGIEIQTNETVPYSFEMSSVLCQYWDKGQWSSRGCDVSISITFNYNK
ncbi:hypothetical protein J6590_058696 [Homalodisca vitripennis]|nr:hypothetical protein J6590_058696 [Homalodisca vitripennis]